MTAAGKDRPEEPIVRYVRQALWTETASRCGKCRTPHWAVICEDTKEGGRLPFFVCPYCDSWTKPEEAGTR